MGARYKLLLFGILVGLGLIFLPSDSLAISIYWDVQPPEGAQYQYKDPQECVDNGAPYLQCANSYNAGNCDLPDCAEGFDWTKYTLECRYDSARGDYLAYYLQGVRVCSIGDKCVAGEEGLRYGVCDCSYSPQRYKVCCSGTSTNQCENVAASLQDNNYPPEGQCPGGAVNEKFCGFGGYPACNDPFICGGAPPPTLDSFSGSGDVCTNSYSVSLDWDGTPLPSSDSSCPNGFWVDIDDNSLFSSYSNTCVQGATSLNNWKPFIFQPLVTYYARVYNGSPTNNGHSNTLSLVVPTACIPSPSPPTVDIKANGSDGPITISNNSSAPLSWITTNNPTFCTASGAWSGSKLVSGGSESTGTLSGPNTYTFSISCSNTAGSDTDSVTVNVAAPGCVCVANSWDANLCTRCKADCSGYNTSCTDFGPNSPSPGNDWCSCDQRCPGADNPTCTTSFTVSCSGAVSGSTVNWTATPNPAGTYTYSWTGIDGLTGTSNPISKTYSTSGTKTANVTATRTSDGISASNSCSATIGLPPCTMTANPPSGLAPLNTFLSVGVDTSGMPGSKVSKWDLDGNISTGSPDGFEVTDSALSHTVTYSSTTTPRFKAVDNVTNADLSQTCSTPVSVGAPTPPPVNCAITINGSTGTGSVSGSVGSTFTIDSSTPTLPQYIYIDGPLSNSYGPFSTSPQTVGWSTSGWPGGTYSVSNNCMSRTVSLRESCSVSGSFTLSVYAFSDPVFDTNQWPQMCWWDYNSSPARLICGNRTLTSQAPSQQDLAEVPRTQSPPSTLLAQNKPPEKPSGQVLAGESCRTNSDCPQTQSGNPCAQPTYCQGYYPPDAYSQEQLGTCTTVYNYGTVCSTSSFGGDMYCGGTYTYPRGVGDGICTDTACKTNAECNDNNVCTTESCTGYQIGGCDYSGCYAEKLGSCSYTNQFPSKICQTDGSGNPLKLCSFQQTGSGPSTCSVDYVKCTNVETVSGGDAGTPSSPCCGLTNLQVMQTCTADPYNPNSIYCYVPGNCSNAPFPVNWNYDSDHPFNTPLDNPTTPLSGVRAYAVDDRCGFSYSGVTDSTGYVYFSGIPRYNSGGRFDYDVWANLPANSTFTRGIRNYLTSTWENTPLNWNPLTGGQPRFSSISSGGRNIMIAFGFQGPPNNKISGRVLLDNNFNGCQSSTQAVSGALISVVSLTFAGSPPPQITDALGNYTVQNLAADNYYTAISSIPGRVNARRVDGGAWVSTASSTYGIPPNPPLVLPPSHTVDWCVNPISAWIQTTAGDVHSNSGITIPGGP